MRSSSSPEPTGQTPASASVETIVAQSNDGSPVKTPKGKGPVSDRSKTTLFLRNIPFSCDSQELEKFFSSIGPIKACFVVKENGKKVEDEAQVVEEAEDAGEGEKASASAHKGFGFVHFALEEDAAKAIETLKTQKLGGRRVKGEFALRKHTKFDPSSVQPDVKKAKPAARVTQASKAKAYNAPSKTLIVEFSPMPGQDQLEFNKKQLYKKVRKMGNVAELDYPFEDSTSKARIRYGTVEETSAALKKLHQHQFKGFRMTAQQPEGSPSASMSLKAHRLIVRNLPFSITASQLDGHFGELGKIAEIVLPTKPGTDGQLRGFAFIQFEERDAADAAMKALNGKEIGGRCVAVDWAVGKNLYEQIRQNEQQEGKTKDEEEEDVDVETVDAQDGDEDGEDEGGEDGSDEDVDVVGDSSADDEGEAGSETTIFIRNIAFETTEQSLADAFSSRFGPLEYCRLVVDGKSGVSRGSAFVRFIKAESAQAAVKLASAMSQDQLASSKSSGVDAERMRLQEHMEELKKKRAGRAFPSLLQDPDDLPAEDLGIVLDGRALSVVPAVDRDEAKKLKLARIEPNAGDRRRLGLVEEALIRPISDAAKRFWTEADISERDAFIKTRLKELRRNPNSVIAEERLAIRHLPTALGEDELGKVMQSAIDAALEALKGPKGDMLLPAGPLRDNALRAQPRLVQVKIVRASEAEKAASKDDNAVRVGRSKGYGFVHWGQAAHALLVLRYLTQWAPEAWHRSLPQLFGRRAKQAPAGKKGGERKALAPHVPIVEFAMDKMRVLDKRAQHKAGQQSGAKRAAAPKNPDAAKKPAPPKRAGPPAPKRAAAPSKQVPAKKPRRK